MKVNKNAFAKIFLCFALVFSLFGATLSFLSQPTTNVQASETIAMDDKISITYSEVYEWIQVDFDGFTAEGNTWHDADDSIFSANNGVDPLEYTYVNGRSLRDLYGETDSVYEVYTETDWIESYVVVIWENLENSTIQLKAGFTIVGKDGNAYVLQNDTAVYGWTDGVFVEIVESEPEEPVIEALDYTNKLGLEDRTSWASGGHADIVTFGIMDFGITEGNQYFKSAVSDCWFQGNDAVITQNNGVDILQYVYVNGVSARELLIENQTAQKTTANTGYWLSNPAAWPIALETGTDCWIRIDKTKFGGDFTFTFKAGFTLIRQDGAVISLSKDVEYGYANGTLSKVQKSTVTFNNESSEVVSTKSVVTGQAIGELPAVPAKNGYVGYWAIDGVKLTAETVISEDKVATPVYMLEYKDLLGIEDRTSWGANGDDEYYFGGVTLEPFGYFNTAASVSGCWNVTWDENYAKAFTANNHGVDIMEYIYINGEQAREACTTNGTTNEYAGANGGWLGNGGVCAPVCVETTNGSGILIRVLKAYTGNDFTITFKAGFTLVRNDGEVIYLSEDVNYQYENGVLSKVVTPTAYTLSFESSEGSVDAISVTAGQAISNLPAVPAKDGYTGVWTIDGATVTNETIYNYGANKTAVAVYTLIPVVEKVDITERLQMEDRSWGAHDGEVYVGMLDTGITHASGNQYFNTLVCGAWYVGNDEVITANGGVDIMQYILVNGVSARDLITANYGDGKPNATNSCSCWLSNPAAYPVFVESTNGSGLMMRFATAEFGRVFTITIKAGFTITNSSGEVVTITKDIDFVYNNGIITKEDSPVRHTLSFECDGATFDSIIVKEGRPIANLPELPARDGFVAFWSIDGVDVTNESIYNYTEDKTAVASYVQNVFTLSFDGADAPVDAISVTAGQAIANLPAVPARENYEAVWTIDGKIVTAETIFDYASDKTAVAVYTEVIDITDRIFIEDRTWGVHAQAQGQELYVALLDTGIVNIKDGSENNWLNTSAAVNGCWHNDNPNIIKANGGVDILEYIYINGKSSRAIITENRESEKPIVCCTCWLSNPAASPVYAESTIDSGLMIRFAKEYTGGVFSITIKAGFRIINAQGKIVEVREDVEFSYANGAISRDYTLSFEGVEGAEAKTVTFGTVIGELPEIPARDGFIAYWAIEGEQITAESGYNYFGSKTAVATYVKDTFNMYFEGTDTPVDSIVVKTGRVIDNLPAVPEKEGFMGYWTIDGVQISDMTVFSYGADVTAVATYVESIDITDRLFMENRAWGAHDGELYVALLDMARLDDEGLNWFHTHESVNGVWYLGNNDIIVANGGYDILQYILINGKSARALLNENNATQAHDCGGIESGLCWLSNPVAYPVAVETTKGSGLMIRTMLSIAGEEWVITIKAGFTILDVDGNRVHVSKDINFSLNEDGAIVRDYVLTFGENDVREITYGDLIGELPEVPAKAGYTGVWAIDGNVISAETPYHYYGNKNATVLYTAIDYVITINRANGDVETLIFNDLTKAEVLAKVALTADNLFYAYSWQEALPTELEYKDYTFVEVRVDQPASTRIISYSLSIGVDFSMNVYAEVIGDMPEMRFVMGDREVVVQGILVNADANKYVFVFSGIKACDLAETFSATLFIGETVIDSVEYSVEAYLNKLAVKDGLSEAYKTLIADIIVYGQKAEEFAGKDTGIQDIDGCVASEFVDLTESDKKITISKDEDVYVTKAYVEYDGNARIAVLFRAVDVSKVTVTINNEQVDFALLEDAIDVYKVVTENLSLTNTGVNYVIKIFVDGKEVQRVVYDQNSYVYEVQGETENELCEIVKAIYNLSASAKESIADNEGV